jgi:hypothetical protein
MRKVASGKRLPAWAWLLFACIGLVGLLGFAVGLSSLSSLGGIARSLMGDGGTVDPPGDPRAFDPVARYAEVAAFAGPGVALLRMQAEQVRSDGSLDLGADYQPAPRAQYEFVREVPPPANAPPLGAGAPADGRWHQRIEVDLSRPGRLRYVRKVGKGGILETQYVLRGMERREGGATGSAVEPGIAPPTCPLQGLWKLALAQGVPANAVARIEYDRDGYDFGVRDTRWSLHFAADCSLQPVD